MARLVPTGTIGERSVHGLREKILRTRGSLGGKWTAAQDGALRRFVLEQRKNAAARVGVKKRLGRTELARRAMTLLVSTGKLGAYRSQESICDRIYRLGIN